MKTSVDEHFNELMRTSLKFRCYWYGRQAVHNGFYILAWSLSLPVIVLLFLMSKLIPWSRFAFNDFAVDISDILETLSWDLTK